jgi:hypothetical protein
VVLGLCAVSMLLLKKHHFAITERAIQWPDALGLGLFAATGVHQALAQQMPVLIAVMMGVVTACLAVCCATWCATKSPPPSKTAAPTPCARLPAPGSMCWLGRWTCHCPLR